MIMLGREYVDWEVLYFFSFGLLMVVKLFVFLGFGLKKKRYIGGKFAEILRFAAIVKAIRQYHCFPFSGLSAPSQPTLS